MKLNLKITNNRGEVKNFTSHDPLAIYKELASAFYATIKKRPHKTMWKDGAKRGDFKITQYYTEQETQIKGFSVKYEYEASEIYL